MLFRSYSLRKSTKYSGNSRIGKYCSAFGNYLIFDDCAQYPIEIKIIDLDNGDLVCRRKIERKEGDKVESFLAISKNEVLFTVSSGRGSYWDNRSDFYLVKCFENTKSFKLKKMNWNTQDSIIQFVALIQSEFSKIIVYSSHSSEHGGFSLVKNVGAFEITSFEENNHTTIINILSIDSITSFSYLDKKIYCFQNTNWRRGNPEDNAGIKVFDIDSRCFSKNLKVENEFWVADLTKLDTKIQAIGENQILIISNEKIIFLKDDGSLKLLVRLDHRINCYFYDDKNSVFVFLNRNRFYSLQQKKNHENNEVKMEIYPSFHSIPEVSPVKNVRLEVEYGFPKTRSFYKDYQNRKKTEESKKRDIGIEKYSIFQLEAFKDESSMKSSFVTVVKGIDKKDYSSFYSIHLWDFVPELMIDKGSKRDWIECIQYFKVFVSGEEYSSLLKDHVTCISLNYGVSFNIPRFLLQI